MATYKGIQGYSVQNLSSDPTVADVVGQLWYNSGSGKFKVAVQAAGTWSAGGAIGTTRYSQAGAGVATAGLIFGGGPPIRALTESYNGTAWTEVNDLNTTRQLQGGMGTQTAALSIGGSQPPASAITEQWDGTSWTEVNDLNTDTNHSCYHTLHGYVHIHNTAIVNNNIRCKIT